MSSQTLHATEYVWPPSVVGFDMPSTTADRHGGMEPVMVAFLSVRPDYYWIEAFSTEIEDFKRRHQLLEVRIDFQSLVIIGDAIRLRGLTGNLRNFVHRISRISSQRRVTDQMATKAALMPADAECISVKRDLDLIARMPSLAGILESIARETDMRLVVVARVSDTRWTACAVLDTIGFGLLPGQDLVLETTICNEIRKSGQPVVINNVSMHPVFSKHRTPTLYGFESYISVPIHRRDGGFFGTLCAVDPQPCRLDETILKIIEMHARAISEALESGAP